MKVLAYRLALPLAITVLTMSVKIQPAYASGWTWDAATHPDGLVNIGGSASGGGLWLYHGIYYLPGAGHVDYQLGLGMWETPNEYANPPDPAGSGFIGHVSHTTYCGGGSACEPDLGLIATGTAPIVPSTMVSAGWQDAPIESYATGNGDLPAGAWVCLTGYSWQTEQAGLYRCGTLTADCTRSAVTCQAFNANGLVSAGDSGGLVWWYSGSGVEVDGWVSTGNATPISPNGSYEYMNFVPPWQLAHYSWPVSQTWQGGAGIAAFPSGNDGTGCFVTISGCQTD